MIPCKREQKMCNHPLRACIEFSACCINRALCSWQLTTMRIRSRTRQGRAARRGPHSHGVERYKGMTPAVISSYHMQNDTMVLTPQPSFSLKGTDIRIPSCGLGTFQPDPSLYPDTSVKDSVLQALKIGYHHSDAALAYGWGSVERDIGDAIRESQIPREELFVVTKLYVYEPKFHKLSPGLLVNKINI